MRGWAFVYVLLGLWVKVNVRLVNESSELRAAHDRNYQFLDTRARYENTHNCTEIHTYICICVCTYVCGRELSGKTCVNINVKYLILIFSYRYRAAHLACLFSMVGAAGDITPLGLKIPP